MEARAMARYVRVTPRKARRVVDMIRGMPAEEAQAVLSFAPQAASAPVRKVLASAVANAGQAGSQDPSALVISRAWVDEGPTLKRFRPRAQGRGYRILKRTSHITVIVSDEQSGGGREARGREKQSGGGREARGREQQSGGGREARGREQQSAAHSRGGTR